MTRRLLVTLLLMVAVTGCDRGSKPPGLEDAGPGIAAFIEAGKALEGLGAAVASLATAQNQVPVGYEDRLRDLGSAARRVVARAQPEGRAGAAAIQEELAKASTAVVRHIVTAAGGADGSTNTMVSAPPDEVAFDINVPYARYEDDGADTSKKGKVRAKSLLKASLMHEIEHFVYAALLVDPAARNKLAPRRSPEDVPDALPDLNLSVRTAEGWRDDLFDSENRLVVPSPLTARKWVSFSAWTTTVNPAIASHVRQLTKAPIDELNI